MSAAILDLTGWIFKHKTSYWKIMGPARNSYGSKTPDTYPVIKCTKTGKEFTGCNGFSIDFVMKLYNAGEMSKCELTENVEVSTAGQESGIRKRRIQHLEAELSSALKEVNQLLAEERGKYRYNLTVVPAR